MTHFDQWNETEVTSKLGQKKPCDFCGSLGTLALGKSVLCEKSDDPDTLPCCEQAELAIPGGRAEKGGEREKHRERGAQLAPSDSNRPS